MILKSSTLVLIFLLVGWQNLAAQAKESLADKL